MDALSHQHFVLSADFFLSTDYYRSYVTVAIFTALTSCSAVYYVL